MILKIGHEKKLDMMGLNKSLVSRTQNHLKSLFCYFIYIQANAMWHRNWFGLTQKVRALATVPGNLGLISITHIQAQKHL